MERDGPIRSAGRRPTSFDVAQLAGVSQPTVSRALRGDASIRADTRDRVAAAAAQIGYRPHRHAARLRAASTGAIALVLLTSADADRAALNPLYYDLLGAVEAAATRRGFNLQVSYQGGAALRCDFEQRGEADGVIVIGSAAHGDGWRFFTDAAQGGCNVVAWGAPEETLPTIRAEGREGAAMAVDHLVAGGRRRIAFVAPGWQDHHAYGERRAGYLAALARHGLTPIEVPASAEGDRVDQGDAATARLLDSGASFDAVFAACDALAVGAIRCLRHAGRDVPGDVAVVGFDGTYGARHCDPALTTVEQDVDRAGELLVEAVLTGTVPAPPVPVRLVVRESA